jgi:hypothetical protein
VKNTFLRNLALGAGAFIALSGCSSEDAPKTTTNTGGSTTSGSSSAATTSGSSTTNGSSGATGGSGGGAATTGGSAGSGGAGGSGGSAGSAGSGGAGGASGGGGAGGSGGRGGSAGSGGSGGSGDGGVACNTNPGKALQFDATAVDMMTGDLGMDFPGADTPRTIELWAKFLGAQSWQAEHTVIETGLKPTSGSPGNMVLGIDLSGYMGTTAEFGPYTNGFSDNNHPNGVFVMNVAQTGWVHLSWTYTGNHGMFHFTVDGKEYPVITQGGQATMAFTPGIVTLGASQAFGFPGWAGVMDEVRLWKVARTAQQISDNMRVVLKPTEPGLVAYYRFSEGSGAFTDDESMTMSHRLSTCTATSGRCLRANTASPMWVASDIPGTFTCAP